MIHLQSIDLKPSARKQAGFPFTLPLVRSFERIEFRSPVTFFVGENGSGKSTMMEALAAGGNSIAVAGEDLDRDKTLRGARELGKRMNLQWKHRSHRGFFLRAEDFFNFAKRIEQTKRELQEIADGFEADLQGDGLARAQGYVLGQRRALIDRYGENLDAHSHGESFLKLFQSRFVPGGFYLLDEPEAPLSPQRQLAFLALLKQMVADDAQFIIATHSPILMAFPGAVILNFDQHPVREIAYDDVEHVSLTRAFLNSPQSFLRHL